MPAGTALGHSAVRLSEPESTKVDGYSMYLIPSDRVRHKVIQGRINGARHALWQDYGEPFDGFR